MIKYEKIETVFSRDTTGTKKLMPGVFRDETVKFLKDSEWEWTEKVDGTNIGIVWDGYKISYQGRTKQAEIQYFLLERLNEIFGSEEVEELFEELFGTKEVILFGEGFGNKIQKVGSKYNPYGVDFILFDVLINGNYQSRDNVEKIAKSFNIPVVPIIGHGSIDEAIAFVKTNPESLLGNCKMEGLVCRPKVELRNRCGKRIIVKIKWDDFKNIS